MVVGYFVLDVVSAAATLLAALFFVRAWLRSRAPLLLLLSIGFLLLCASYPFVAASELRDAGPDAYDVLRFAGQTGGALVLALAYAASHGGRAASPFPVLGWSAAVTAVLAGGLVAVVRLTVGLPRVDDVALVAHVVQALSFATCAALASTAYRRLPTIDRALVPLAFAVWALGKLTWVFIDMGSTLVALPIVYACRLAAIALVLLAVALPVRAPSVPRAGRGADPA